MVDILAHQADRRAGRLALEHARQDAHLIGLLPLRRVARLAGTALVEKGLDVGLRQRQPRWATVDDRAERRPVAFTPGRESKDASEAVETHARGVLRSEEHTSELQSLMRHSYAVFCLKKKKLYK